MICKVILQTRINVYFLPVCGPEQFPKKTTAMTRSTVTAMALRAVLSTASRAPAAAPAARMAAAASAPRFFSSDAAKEAEAAAKEAAAKEAALAAENALMEQLQKQQAHDAEVTGACARSVHAYVSMAT